MTQSFSLKIALLVLILPLFVMTLTSPLPYLVPRAYADTGITRVQGNAKGNSTSSTTISVTLEKNPKAGNVLIAAVGGSGYAVSIRNITERGVTWSPMVQYDVPLHWDGTVDQIMCEIWLGRVGLGASSNMTVYLRSAARWGAICDVCEYENINTTSPLDQYGSGGTEAYNNSPGIGYTFTTTQSNELWIGAIFTFAGSQSNPDNGFLLMDGAANSNGVSLAYLEKIVNATGRAACSTTTSNPGPDGLTIYAGTIATFKGGSGVQSFSPMSSQVIVIVLVAVIVVVAAGILLLMYAKRRKQ